MHANYRLHGEFEGRIFLKKNFGEKNLDLRKIIYGKDNPLNNNFRKNNP